MELFYVFLHRCRDGPPSPASFPVTVLGSSRSGEDRVGAEELDGT